MDRFYFLHTKSLCDIDYESYKSGLTALNSLTIEKLDDEKILKNIAIFQNPFYVKLCEDCSETAVILQFIEQCKSEDKDIDSDAMFQEQYPDRWVGFLGINFGNTTGVAYQRQVIDISSLLKCRIYFYDNLIKYGDDVDLSLSLQYRFPSFSFTRDAINDLLWWKHNRRSKLDSIITLLDDIISNPFTGGLGKTEVLSNSNTPIISKRITQGDRLTYTYGEKTIIHHCKGHYE